MESVARTARLILRILAFWAEVFDNEGEKYPKGSDYRVYWLTVSMNIMGKRGFQLAHMDGTDVVMKRQVK